MRIRLTADSPLAGLVEMENFYVDLLYALAEIPDGKLTRRHHRTIGDGGCGAGEDGILATVSG